MAKDTATGVLVTPVVVSWTTLRQTKGGIEGLAEGQIARAPVPESIQKGDVDTAVDAASPLTALAVLKSPVVLALPSTHLLLRILDLPAVDDDDLVGMVELQVDKFSPFPIDQMVISHEVLSRDPQGCSVLVAAARQKAVDEAGDVLKGQGLRIERVDAGLLGRWKSIVDAGQVASEGRETLLIVSDETVEMLTHDAGTLIALSCLGKVPDLTDAAVAADIAQEVAHLRMGLEVERGRVADTKLTLWSDSALRPFAEALRQTCGVTVEERALEVLSSVAHGIAARALSGAGLLDLTPEPWRLAMGGKRVRRQMLIGSLAVFGLWALLVGGGLGWFAFEQGRLQRMKAEEARWLEPANEVRRLRLQVNMIERYTDRTFSALESLREISRLQPEGVDLSTFTYRKGDGMDIDGEADSGLLVNQFNEALNQSPLFAEVKPGTRTLTKQGRHRFSFVIRFTEVAE